MSSIDLYTCMDRETTTSKYHNHYNLYMKLVSSKCAYYVLVSLYDCNIV